MKPAIEKNYFTQRGIYCIENLFNGKKIVGQTFEERGFRERWRKHLYKLNKNIHSNTHLQNSWNKYGPENFKFYVIEILNEEEKLTEREQYWADYFDTFNPMKGYNKGFMVDSARGQKRTLESRKKMSESHKGCIPWNKGKKGIFKHTEEWKKEASKRRKGTRVGDKCPTAKLTWEKVREIRKIYEKGEITQQKLADIYGVSRGCILGIIYNINWKE